jgi:hypothetical protein
MKNVILVWVGMIIFMFLGLSFVKLQINPYFWNENTRMVFFLFSIFGLVFSFIFNELISIGKKDK